MSYIIAVHVPIAGLALLPVFSKELPLLLAPIHIAFLELISDPACSVVFEAEPEEKGIMKRPPRKLDHPILGWRRILIGALQGLGVLSMVLAVYFFLMQKGYSMDDVRSISFCTLLIGNTSLIFANLSWRHSLFTFNFHNKTIFYVLGGIALFFILIFYVPAVRRVFHLGVIHWDDFLISVLAGIGGVLWFEIVKLFRRGTLGENF